MFLGGISQPWSYTRPEGDWHGHQLFEQHLLRRGSAILDGPSMAKDALMLEYIVETWEKHNVFLGLGGNCDIIYIYIHIIYVYIYIYIDSFMYIYICTYYTYTYINIYIYTCNISQN